jgi:fermentation-respiration switch protein FrsA (DUF1100 family)
LIPALFSILGVYLLALVIIDLIAWRRLFMRPLHSLEYSRQRCLENGEFERGLESLPWENAFVFSPQRRGRIAVYALKALPEYSGADAGTLIVLHGLTWTHYGSFKYARGFIERGWNVVLMDMGGHGASERGRLPVPAYGYFEKYDLDAVVDWALTRFPGQGPLILAGESLGAATVLQYAPLGAPPRTPREAWKIQGVIADCSYSTMADAVDARLGNIHVPYVLAFPARKLLSLLLKGLWNYALEDASPLNGALSSPVPMLFIHGGEDTYVPFRMSVLMAEKRRAAGTGPAALVIIPGAVHAKSVIVDRETWFREAFDFIRRECLNAQQEEV